MVVQPVAVVRPLPASAELLFSRIATVWFVDRVGEQRACTHATVIPNNAPEGTIAPGGRIQLREEKLECGMARHSLLYSLRGDTLLFAGGLSWVSQRGAEVNDTFRCADRDERVVRDERGLVLVGDAPWFATEEACKQAERSAAAFELSGACATRLLRDVDPKRGLVERLPATAVETFRARVRSKRSLYIPVARPGDPARAHKDIVCQAWEIKDAAGLKGTLVRSEESMTLDGSSRVVTSHRKPYQLVPDCQVLQIVGPSSTSHVVRLVEPVKPHAESIGLGDVSTMSHCLSQDPLLEANERRLRFGDVYWYFEREACERDVATPGLALTSAKPGGC